MAYPAFGGNISITLTLGADDQALLWVRDARDHRSRASREFTGHPCLATRADYRLGTLQRCQLPLGGEEPEQTSDIFRRNAQSPALVDEHLLPQILIAEFTVRVRSPERRSGRTDLLIVPHGLKLYAGLLCQRTEEYVSILISIIYPC